MKQRIWKEAESHRGRQEQSHIGEAEVIRRNEKIRVRMLKVRERERKGKEGQEQQRELFNFLRTKEAGSKKIQHILCTGNLCNKVRSSRCPYPANNLNVA